MEFFPALFLELETAARAMTLLEVAGVIFNLVAVVLTIRASVLNFPVGIVGCMLAMIFFWGIGLYAEAMLQLFFAALVLFGWWNWLRPQNDAEELPVRFAPPNALALGLLVAGFVGVFWGVLLDRFTPSTTPFWDACLAAFSVLGQFFVARKWVENWPIWVAVNFVSIGLFWHKQAHLYAVLYAFFIVLALLGWREWNKKTAR